MKYIVTGDRAEFGLGQKLRLSAAQIEVRGHSLEVVDADKGIVTATGILVFKRGEEIDLLVKADEFPRELALNLTLASKVPGEGRASKKSSVKASQNVPEKDEPPTLDDLEEALEAAEAAYKVALEANKLPEGLDLTDEQKALVATEAKALEDAKAAYDAAIGE